MTTTESSRDQLRAFIERIERVTAARAAEFKQPRKADLKVMLREAVEATMREGKTDGSKSIR